MVSNKISLRKSLETLELLSITFAGSFYGNEDSRISANLSKLGLPQKDGVYAFCTTKHMAVVQHFSLLSRRNVWRRALRAALRLRREFVFTYREVGALTHVSHRARPVLWQENLRAAG